MLEEARVIGEGLRETGQGGTLVRSLQYEVREGREAGEVVVVPSAFIANRNSSFILHLEFFNEDGDEGRESHRGDGGSEGSS